MYISDFWFLKLHLRDFNETGWEIFKCHEIMKNIEIAHFLGQFSIRNCRILQTKNSSWWSAWKNKENGHLRFFILETSSHRFVQNLLRDFAKHGIMENMKISHFLGQFFTRNYWKWQTNNISWGLAWKTKKNVHLGFFILESSSQRFFANIVLKP